MRYYMLLTATALLNCVGTLLMRYGGNNLCFSQGITKILSDGWLWLIGMVLCWGSGLAFALLLTRVAVTDALSYYTPLVYVFIMLGGIFLLKEPVSLSKLLGMGCILIGLVLICRN